jgi:hypothetical protein
MQNTAITFEIRYGARFSFNTSILNPGFGSIVSLQNFMTGLRRMFINQYLAMMNQKCLD